MTYDYCIFMIKKKVDVQPKTDRLSFHSRRGLSPKKKRPNHTLTSNEAFLSHSLCDLNQISEIGFAGREATLTIDIAFKS